MRTAHTCPNCAQEIVNAAFDAEHGVEICPLCGAALTSPVQEAVLPEGFMVAGFRIERVIGRGNMGTVYFATQMNLERPVALKILSQRLAHDEAFVERFFREARAAASLSHPNIVQAYDAGSADGGLFYFAMELVEGETLERRIASAGRLPVRDAVDVASKIADALNHAWLRQKLCHGDVKPENIIIDAATGVAKLADLGLAKSMHEESGGDLMATPLYAPPEVISGDHANIGAQSDMYSFGATLYHMLAGHPPFPGDDPNAVMERQLHEKPAPVSSHIPEIGPELTAFVAKLLEKSPSARPSSWNDVAETLKRPFDPDHKVLRIHSASKSSSGLKPDRQAIDDENSFFGRNMPLIIICSFLFIAAAGIGSLFAIKSHQAALAEQAAAQAREERPKPAENEWKVLKDSLPSMRHEQAISALQWYLDKHKDAAQPEAVEYMALLRERVTEPFRAAMASLRKDLADGKGIPKMQSAELRRIDSTIASALSQAASSPWLAGFLPEQERRSLEQARASIKAELARRQAVDAAKGKAEQELKAREHSEAEQRRKQEERRKADAAHAAAAKAQAFDSFTELLASGLPLQERGDAARKGFSAALKNFKATLPAGPDKSLALLRRAVEMPSAFPDIFVDRFEQALKGLPLTDDSSPGFVADSADAQSVKLIQEEGKVKIGKRVAWSQFKPESFESLLRDRLLAKSGAFQAAPLNLQEAVLAELLLYARTELFDSALKASSLKPDQKDVWSSCATLAFSAKRESEALALWRNSQSLVSKGAYADAVAALSDLSGAYSGTLCFERHSPAIKALLGRYSSLSPALMAKELHEKAKAAQAKGDLDEALGLASSAALRFGFLSSLDPSLCKRILDTRDAVLSARGEASQVKALSDTKLPFYYWDRERPGDAWQYRNVVASSSTFPPDNPVFAAMSFSAGLDAGIWDNLSGELRNTQARLSALTASTGPLRNWTPSVLFGLSVGADRLQASYLKPDLVAGMKAVTPGMEGVMIRLSGVLAVEQAMLFRDYKAASALAAATPHRQQDAGRQMQRIDFEAALLKILVALQTQELKPDALKALVEALANEYAKESHFSADINACRLALSLLSQQAAAPSASDFETFKSSRQAFPDICARLLADAFAKAAFQGSRRGIESQTVIAALEAKLSPSLASSGLWDRVLCLKLSTARSPEAFSKVVDAALEDCRICASPSYTRLLLLKASAQMALKQSSQAAASAYFASFALGCPVLSPSEERFDEISAPSSAMPLVSGLLKSGEAKEALWLGVASVIANHGSAGYSAAVCKMLLEFPSLTWAERLLLKSPAR